MISVDLLTRTLIAIGLTPTLAKIVAPALPVVLDRYKIVGPKAVGCFLGQNWVESTGFTMMEENLNYTTLKRLETVFGSSVKGRNDLLRNPQKLANYEYANRNGNGNEASGDGWRYRGSGWGMITGKANFAAAAKKIGIDVVAKPELMRTDWSVSAAAAAEFFSRTGCIKLAETLNHDKITLAINGKAMEAAVTRASKSRTAASFLTANWT